MTLYYVSAAECAEWDDGTTPGWYFATDELMLLNMNGEIDVPAGQGFLFKPYAGGLTLRMPGAID